MCRNADTRQQQRALLGVGVASFYQAAELVNRRDHEHGHDCDIRDVLPFVVPRWQHGSELGEQLTAHVHVGDVVGVGLTTARCVGDVVGVGLTATRHVGSRSILGLDVRYDSSVDMPFCY